MASHKPSIQRRALYSAPLHVKRETMSLHLEPKIRKEIGKRALLAKRGDTAKVMKGKHKGKSAKIIEVNLYKGFIYLEKITVKKSDGSDAKIPFRPSNLMLIEIDQTDKRRINKERKKPEKKPVAIKQKKTRRIKAKKTTKKKPGKIKKKTTISKKVRAKKVKKLKRKTKTIRNKNKKTAKTKTRPGKRSAVKKNTEKAKRQKAKKIKKMKKVKTSGK